MASNLPSFQEFEAILETAFPAGFTIDLSLQSLPNPHWQPTSRRWHPKITPYRLFVLLTTCTLGTAKALLTYHGKVMVSITLEWIMGVVISLLFYALGVCEAIETRPIWLAWFYSYDCMDLVWRILGFLSWSGPSYQTRERATVNSSHSSHPSITGYRILVTTLVATFGMVKAACAYLGRNTAANVFDWMFAVMATSFLYIVGLYELNSIGLAPSFFVKDYSAFLIKWGIFGLCVLTIFVCLASIALLWQMLTSLIGEPEGIYLPQSRIDGILDFSLKFILAFHVIIFLVPGIFVLLFLCLWKVNNIIRSPKGFIPSFLSSVKHRILSALRQLFTLWKLASGTICLPFSQFRYSHLAIRIFIHVFIHLLAAMICASVGFSFFGLSLKLAYSIDRISSSMGTLFFVVLLGGISLPCAVVLLLILRFLIKPLYLYDDPVAFNRSLFPFSSF